MLFNNPGILRILATSLGWATRSCACLIVVVATCSHLVACASTPPAKRSGNQVRDGVRAADDGYWEEAEFRWLKAIAINAANARAVNNLAIRFERLGEFESAKAQYDRALSLAGTDERPYVAANSGQFERIWKRIHTADSNSETQPSTVEPPEVSELPPPGLGVMEITISVPTEDGPNLAGFTRILVGSFIPTADSEVNLSDSAVRFFRRRIVQRTFFQTVEGPMLPRNDPSILSDSGFWIARAEEAEADLVLIGRVGLGFTDESRIVRERIRSPVSGEIEEIARFREVTGYHGKMEYKVLRGKDGEQLLEGTATADVEFAVEDDIDQNQATVEVFEALLPQILDAITPKRAEGARYLIY